MSWNLPENPFVGLRPFEAEESLLFFGRNEQTRELLQQLHRTRFLSVVGSSGCGKSSLIRAGLIPRLQGGFLVEDRDEWLIARMKPGGSPVLHLATALLQALGEGNQQASASFAAAIREQGVRAVLDELAVRLQNRDANLFLLIDQFEEIFRFGLSSDEGSYREEAAEFVALMLGLAEQRELPIYVTMTMRSDFLGECDAFLGLPEAMNRSQYLVPRLTRQQRREAIIGPIRLYQSNISDRLTDRLLNETGEARDDLPVLQHALMRTWTAAHRNGQVTLDLPHYTEIGTIHEALSQHAESALQGMEATALAVTQKMFKGLTELDAGNRAIRRPARVSELQALCDAGPQQIWQTIQQFRSEGRSFLVVSSENMADDPLVDISHESLIRQWHRLAEWVKDEAQSAKIYLRLAETATLHQEGKASYYRDPDLQIALDWQKQQEPNATWARRYHPGFETAMTFLDESRAIKAAEIRAKKARRRNRIVAGAIAALAVLGFAVWEFFLHDALTIGRMSAHLEALGRNEISVETYQNRLRETELRLNNPRKLAPFRKVVADLIEREYYRRVANPDTSFSPAFYQTTKEWLNLSYAENNWNAQIQALLANLERRNEIITAIQFQAPPDNRILIGDLQDRLARLKVLIKLHPSLRNVELYLDGAPMSPETVDGENGWCAVARFSTSLAELHLRVSAKVDTLEISRSYAFKLVKLRRAQSDKNGKPAIIGEVLSIPEVVHLLDGYDFYSSNFNPEGQGYSGHFRLNDDRFYVLPATGVVVDSATGLIWQKSGSSGKLDLTDVHNYIEKLNKERVAEFANWRLPTLEEAMSLMERERKKGIYLMPVFDRKQTQIWTTDEFTGIYTKGPWLVDFDGGRSAQGQPGQFGEKFYVRAVCSGQ